MDVNENFSLKALNTLSIDVKAKQFVEWNSYDQISQIVENVEMDKLFILGSGSNTLFTKDYDGLVIHVNTKGVQKLDENNESVLFEVMGGEDWIKFVEDRTAEGYSGLENLAFIPGTLGAAPVQNIAAYGQVFEDILEEVEVYDLSSRKFEWLKKEQCEFSYRSSIFKKSGKGRLISGRVRVKLSKIPNFDTHYHSRYPNESLSEWLKKVGEPPYSPADVAKAVTMLRKYKLPDPKLVGTCGSYFRNPFVTVEQVIKLQEAMPDLQIYPVDKMQYVDPDLKKMNPKEKVKVPAGRILDELGWKGKWIGNVGTHERQALCVITNKKASGEEVKRYVDMMKQSVIDQFGIELDSEVVTV